MYFHITASTPDKKWFQHSMPKVWNHCLYKLKKAHQRSAVDIIGFVLMSNHYHLLIRSNYPSFKTFISQFDPNYFSTLKIQKISNKKYLRNCYRYIYQNPLRAKVTTKSEFYPYSTLHNIYKQKSFPIPIVDFYGFKDEYQLRWLNTPIEEKEAQEIKDLQIILKKEFR